MTFERAVLAEVEARISALDLRAGAVVVGIDGRGGAGKSTLARSLATLLPETAIVQFDDFYRPQGDRQELGSDFDWRRLEAEVLAPLATGKSARYQRYDWDTGELAEWHDVPAQGVVIIEGNYSTRPELRDYYDLTIWVETAHDLRLARGLERDGEQARATWLEEWIPEEDRYIEACAPADHADVVVDGTAS